MRFAVALLAAPAGTYGCLVVALAALVYACHARTFVPAFTGTAAAALTLLAFLMHRPDATAAATLALGVVLLHAEFRFATYGAAAVLGLAICAWSSWLLLAPPTWLRVAATLFGTLLLFAAVLRGMRVRTLPRP
jgi:membrane-bound ClpP family serine protease